MQEDSYTGQAAELTEKQSQAVAALLQSGDEAFDADEFERALDCYHRASLVDGSNPQIWNALGMTYYNMEFPREAWRSYKLALHCDPDNLETLWYAGEFLYNMDDAQLALAVLTRYRELETDEEKISEADELIEELREQVAVLSPDAVEMAAPDYDPMEDDGEEEDLDGFVVEGEETEESELDDFGDELLDDEAEDLPLDTEAFVASLSLQVTRMDSKCNNCSINIPQDAPYCYSCKAPNFYD